MDPKKVQRAKDLYASKSMTVPEIMKLTGFKSKDTFYKYIVYHFKNPGQGGQVGQWFVPRNAATRTPTRG